MRSRFSVADVAFRCGWMSGRKGFSEKEAAKFLDGVKGILMVEYGEASPEVKERFNSGLKSYLGKLNIIADIKEDDTLIENIILCSPEEGFVMCLEGVIRMNDIDAAVNMAIK